MESNYQFSPFDSDYTLSFPERVNGKMITAMYAYSSYLLIDLLSRMTIPEKIQQLITAAPAIESLDIPAYQW